MKKKLITIAAVLMIAFAGCASNGEMVSDADKTGDSGVEAGSADVTQKATEKPVKDEEYLDIDLSDYDLVYGNADEFKKIYEKTTIVENAENFEGSFNRTNVNNSYAAELKINRQDSEGFDFELECTYYSHSGYMEGKAQFVLRNVAVYEYSDEWSEDGECQYVIFKKNAEGVNVIASGNSSELGFGMNVCADGLYVSGEPEYTNATILNDLFTSDEQEGLKILIGDFYDECFKTVVENGIINATDCELSDGTQAVFYEAFIPTMGGYEFELLITANDDMYFYTENSSIGWKTNVSGAVDFPEYDYNTAK